MKKYFSFTLSLKMKTGYKKYLSRNRIWSNDYLYSPKCRVCGIDMVARLRRSNGNKFWGCKNYPNCKETLNMPKKLKAVSGKQIKVKPVNTGILGKYKKSKDY